jgi:predicted RNase H-like HicB family nuclease
MRATYTVVYEPDDNGDWLVTVPGVPGAHTFGRTLAHAREMAREVIALVLDTEPDSFDVADEVRLGEKADKVVGAARTARARAEVASAEAQEATLAALGELDGLTVRDAAEVLGVSFQRVHQLRTAALSHVGAAVPNKSTKQPARKAARATKTVGVNGTSQNRPAASKVRRPA